MLLWRLDHALQATCPCGGGGWFLSSCTNVSVSAVNTAALIVTVVFLLPACVPTFSEGYSQWFFVGQTLPGAQTQQKVLVTYLTQRYLLFELWN